MFYDSLRTTRSYALAYQALMELDKGNPIIVVDDMKMGEILFNVLEKTYRMKKSNEHRLKFSTIEFP